MWHPVVWGATCWYACSPSPAFILNTSRLTAAPWSSNTIHFPAQPTSLLPGSPGKGKTHWRTHTGTFQTVCAGSARAHSCIFHKQAGIMTYFNRQNIPQMQKGLLPLGNVQETKRSLGEFRPKHLFSALNLKWLHGWKASAAGWWFLHQNDLIFHSIRNQSLKSKPVPPSPAKQPKHPKAWSNPEKMMLNLQPRYRKSN